MRSFICSIAGVALCAGFTWGNSEDTAGAEPKTEPQKAVQRAKLDHAEVTVKLRDGTSLQCKLLTDPVPVETSYGTLRVPAIDLLVIYQGGHKEKIGAAGATPVSEPDVVVAKEFTISGRVAADGYEVESPLGNLKIELEKVESLSRQPLNVPTLTLPASLDTYNIDSVEFKNWRYSATEEPGWTHQTFDDTKWKAAKRHYNPVMAEPGNMVVSPYNTGTQYCFRRCFLLDSQPKTASLTIYANTYELVVNGIKFGAAGSGQDDHDLSGALKRGVNVIAVKVALSPNGYQSEGSWRFKMTAQ